MAAFIDSFDGAAGTLLSSRTGWAKGSGFYDLWQLDGSGSAGHPAYANDGKKVLHDTGSLGHYVKVVLGADFLGSARGCGILLGAGAGSGLTMEDSGGDLYLYLDGGSLQNFGAGWAAGDELEVVWDAAAKLVTVRRNGVQVGAAYDIAWRGWTDNGSSAGLFLGYDGQPARPDVFRSFEAGPLAPPDATPPTLTGAITLGARTASSIETSCPAGADNVAVTAYDVRRNGGAWVDKGLARSHTFTGLAADTAYAIEWAARDAAGNRSAPLLLDTRTYRAGALASTVLLLTGPQDGNPAGFLYAFAGTVQPGDWLSWRTVSGPVPAGGELDANAMGAFSYQGPSPATLVIQPEVNGVDAAETITVTLYDDEQAGLVLAARATVAQALSRGGALVFGALEPLALAARPTVAQARSKGGAISFGGLAPLVLSARGTVAQARSRGGAMVFDNSGGGMDPTVFSSKLRRVVVKDDKTEVLARYAMRPRERLDYCFSFGPWLDDCADTIASYTVTASSAGIAVQQQGRDSGLVAAFVVASSTVTVPAKLTCEITTAAGRVKEACVYITVQEAMA